MGACFHIGPHGPGCPGWEFVEVARPAVYRIANTIMPLQLRARPIPDYVPAAAVLSVAQSTITPPTPALSYNLEAES